MHMADTFLVREGFDRGPGAVRCQEQRNYGPPPFARPHPLGGAVVTIDAAGCQTVIVQALRKAGADYVLAVKHNQGTLHREVKAAFDDAPLGIVAPAVVDRSVRYYISSRPVNVEAL